MTEKQIRVSGAWIGWRVEVEFVAYGPSPNGRTIHVSLLEKLLNVQDEGIIFAKDFDSGSSTSGWDLPGSTRGIPCRM